MSYITRRYLLQQGLGREGIGDCDNRFLSGLKYIYCSHTLPRSLSYVVTISNLARLGDFRAQIQL